MPGTGTDPAGKLAWQGIVYLPENMDESTNRTKLTFNCDATDANGANASANPYDIELIKGSDKTDETLKRGKFYDLCIKAKSSAPTDVETTVTISEWVNKDMGDFGHTWLIINKTKGKVESGVNDEIIYNSNSTNVRMGCDYFPFNDNRPLVIQSEHYVADKRIEFTVNPAIGIDEFDNNDDSKPNTTGTATIWIEADNHVRKYIDVEYKVEPYFEVTPEDAEIFWLENTSSDDSYTRVFTFKTNLGGIKAIQDISGDLNGGTNIEGSSTLKFACDNVNASTGTFTVTAQANPGTSVTHYFTVGPKSDKYSNLKQELKVDVKPPFGYYRIHFAVINDGQDGEGAYNEGIASNPDLWYQNGWGSTTSGDNDEGAVMYAYTQFGESGAAPPPERVWLFSDAFPGTKTTIDTNNDGWYYWTLDPNTKVKNPGGNGYKVEEKSVKPGETLLMFAATNVNYDYNGGFYRHRCPFHMDPGIQLFDFEDREGWIIFDPLSDPYYMIYDDMPIIDVVEYRVYISNSIADSWKCFYINYGHSNNSGGTYSIWHNSSENVGNWRLLTFYAKAPRGEYAKAVTVQYNKNGLHDLPIFGGYNYYDETNPAKAYGYYDGSWHKGKPADVN